MRTLSLSPCLPFSLSISWQRRQRLAPYLFLSPFLVLFAVFMAYPLVRSFVLSFYKAAGASQVTFVGWSNYRFLLTDPVFWLAVANTTVFTVAFLLVQIPASLGLALLLNSRLVWFRNALRFAFFSTHLVGQVFVAVLFYILLAPRHGLVNRALATFDPSALQIDWLSDPALALPAVLLASLWLSIGFGMIYFLAALQGVDRDLYEAAEADGAGRWSQLWHITLPGIRPVLVLMVLIGTIGAFQLFELPYILLQGPGPNYRGLTIVMYLYMTSFEAGDLGYGAAIGWLLVLIILVFTIAQVRISRAAQEH